MDFNELQSWLQRQTALWQQFATTDGTVDIDSIDWRPLHDACQQLASRQGIGLQSDLAEAMAAQLQGFCRFGLRLLTQLRDPQPHHSVETLVMEFSQHLQQQALGVLLRQWKLPEHILRLASSTAPQADGLDPFTLINHLLLHMAPQLKEPRLQTVAAELEIFRLALTRYKDRLQRVHVEASSALLIRLRQSPTPNSLSELHTQWVDCYETAYRAMLLRPDYQRLYADLSNSSMKLTQLGRDYWQQEYRQLGLVPRQDYDDLLRNQHRLRKQLRHSDTQQQQICERLAQLEQELQTQRNRAETSPPPQPPVTTLRKRKA